MTATNVAGSTTKTLSIQIENAAPANLTYTVTTARYTVGAAITENTPTIGSGGTPTAYSVGPSLPSGLTLNTTTGVISGTPTAVTSSATYTVTATNAIGSTTRNLTILVVAPGPHTIYSADGSNLKAYSVDITTGEPIYVGKTFSSPIVSKLVFHPTLDCAFGYSSSNLYALTVNKSGQGSLSEINSAGGLSGPRNLEILTSGAFIFVVNDANPSTQFVSRFSVNPTTCEVTSLGNTSVWTSTVVFSRDLAVAGNNVYVIDTAAQIKHLTVDESGGLSLAQTIGMSLHSNPPSVTPAVGSGKNLRAHPAGTYLYATDSIKAIESFSVNASTGELTSLGTMVNSGTFYVNDPVVDTVNNFLFSTFTSSSSAGVASINLAANGSTGTSSTIIGGDIQTGYSAPQTVGVHTSESGTYVYTTFSYAGNSGAIRLSLNPSTGALTPVGAGLWGALSGY